LTQKGARAFFLSEINHHQEANIDRFGAPVYQETRKRKTNKTHPLDGLNPILTPTRAETNSMGSTTGLPSLSLFLGLLENPIN
jgi:hypothetical protein